MTKNPREKLTIGLLDSGVGGLSVYQEIQNLLPTYRYIYTCDQLFLPYGNRSEEEIIERICQICLKIIDTYKIHLLVIACNTASTTALAKLRQLISIPIIGVVPAIKPASLISKTKIFGVLATSTTLAGSYTAQLINDFASDCKVIKVDSSRLVELAEQKFQQMPINHSEIKHIIRPFLNHKDLDTIVLACTHFPHLREDLEKCYPYKIKWIDSGKSVAKRVVQVSQNILNESTDIERSIEVNEKNKLKNISIFTSEKHMEKQSKELWSKTYNFHVFEFLKI